MKKLRSTALFLFAFYGLPLLAKPELLMAWPVLTLAFFCTVLFVTQPALSVQESKEHRATDGWTIWLIVGVSGVGQIASLVEWAYFRGAPQALDARALCGVALLAGGTAFRLWAIRTLKNNFSATVRIEARPTTRDFRAISLAAPPQLHGCMVGYVRCRVAHAQLHWSCIDGTGHDAGVHAPDRVGGTNIGSRLWGSVPEHEGMHAPFGALHLVTRFNNKPYNDP